MKTRKSKEVKIAENNKRNLAKVNSIIFPSDIDVRYSEKDAYILIRNLNKIYENDVQAVFDFNLNINKNEFIVLVGPSGCGKSTTLRMVCGLEDISSGELFIDGVYTNELAPKDRDIAMVFQSYALYPHMSVYDNIAFGLKIKKVPVEVKDKNGNPILSIDKNHLSALSKRKKTLLLVIKESEKEIANFVKESETICKEKETTSDNNLLAKMANRLCVIQEKIDYENMRIERAREEIRLAEEEYEKAKTTPVPKTIKKHLPKSVIDEKVKEAAKILEITEYLDRKPKALSGGQRQRVALGRAIVRNAKAFLMDEPLSNLDAKLRVQMRAEIVDLHKKVNATTIYVTHDQIEAMTMADRIVVMNEGVVQQIGTPRDIYEKPVNLFVATFIGAPAMNIVNAEVKNNQIVFSTGEKIKLSVEQVKQAKNFYGKEIERLTKINGLLDNALKDETDKRRDVYLLAKDKISEILESHKNKESGEYNVLFGIRPENMLVCEEKNDESITIKVDAVELLGSEYYIHSKIGNEKVVLKLASTLHIERGDTLNVKIDMDKAHIFDSFTKRAMF